MQIFAQFNARPTQRSNGEDENCDPAPAAGILENPANLLTWKLNIEQRRITNDNPVFFFLVNLIPL